MRRLAVMAAVIAAVAPGAALSQSRPISVEIDHATRVSLRAPAGSVVVGNPQIADVTVVDANTLFITGKGYGSTEIVAVDQIGRTVFQANVVVTAPETGQVRVWRGSRVTEMACGTSCAPSVRSAGGGDSAAAAPGAAP